MVKELSVIGAENVKLTLKRVYSSTGVEYVFTMCCKHLLKVFNPCPGDEVALKVDRCFEVEFADGTKTTFCIEGDESGLVFEYQNISNETGISTAAAEPSTGSFLIPFATDGTEHVNSLCVTEITLPVSTDCLELAHLGEKLSLDSILSVVWYEAPQV